MNKTKITYILAGLALYAVSTGVSFGISKLARGNNTPAAPDSQTATPGPGRVSKIDPSIPRTETCPLNGALFTKQEMEAWSKRRPLGVMIENSVDARPQSGLSTADIVYEAVAEGGITRFMGVFHCAAALAGNITLAPVRSARIYFVNLISEYDGLYNHVGGAGNCDDPNVDPRAKALCAISKNKIKDLDQFGRAGDFKTCHRMANRTNKEVAYEHTMACFLEELYKVGEKWGWTNVDKDTKVAWDKNFAPWKFQGKDEKVEGTPATSISYVFWENGELQRSFDVKWEYDSNLNSYKRFNGGEMSVDLNTNEPLYFNTVITQMVKETHTGDFEKHMVYDVIGTGKAKVFMDGVAVDATWSKPTRTARTIYKDTKGKEIKLNPGPIWISLVPNTNTIAAQ